MTYDEWKARDDTPEPEPEWYCNACGHFGRDGENCGCACCTDPDFGRGLYRKFTVTRTNPESQERHSTCSYFVLDVTDDPFAVPALTAYANACRDEYPSLANDIEALLAAREAGR